MKVVHKEKDFYAVYGAKGSVQSYIRLSVPQEYRYYVVGPPPHWVLHKNYIEALQTFEDCEVGNISTKNPAYSVLCLTPEAPDFILEAVWKAWSFNEHPDRGGDSSKFIVIKEAYECIKNERSNNQNKEKKRK